MTFEQAMEPLYRYVDGLTDEQRDRIVTADTMRRYGIHPTHPEATVPCLVQVVHGRWDWWRTTVRHGWWIFATTEWPYLSGPLARLTSETTRNFDRACRRFGESAVVPAIKLRAAATSSREVERPAEAVEVR